VAASGFGKGRPCRPGVQPVGTARPATPGNQGL